MDTLDGEFLNACERGNLNEVLNILYYHDNGPIKLLKTDPNTLDHMHYFHAVCLNGHCDVVEQLFYFDVDVNLRSAYGTPLAVACQGGHMGTVKTLVKHGAKIYDPDTCNPTLTPFFQACKHGHLDILTFLIDEEPDALLELGSQLLVEACREGFLEIVVLLVSKFNINVDGGIPQSMPSRESIAFDMSLETPLQAACSQNQVEVVEYLLQESVEVNVSIVQKYYQVLGKAVRRNFTVHHGKYRKKQTGDISFLEGDFSSANFYDIHKSWFTDYAEQLVVLDLSDNQLHNVPKEILNLPSIREIDLSANNLFELPEVDDVENSRLEEIIASSNNLKHIPMSFFNIECLRHLKLVNNEIISLLHDDVNEQFDMDDMVPDGVTWQCHSLKSLDLARNQLTSIPSAIHAANSLEKLQLRGNKITSFPIGWKCPLRILNLSQNKLTDFKQSVFNTWTQTLVDLNLSSNKLTSISWDICQLQMLQSLDLSNNAIDNMPPKFYWTCSNLRKLNLAGNKLYGVSSRVETSAPSRTSRRFTINRSPIEERVEIEDEFPHKVFGATLESLDLSANKLVAVPSSVCQLTSLEDLNLSLNPQLRSLPPELGNLTECYQLGLEGLHLSEIPKFSRSGGGQYSKDVLTYLRAKQRKAVAYYRMKLMVIGLQGRGKTTLLAALRGGSTLL